jgi:hypothetical protein
MLKHIWIPLSLGICALNVGLALTVYKTTSIWVWLVASIMAFIYLLLV